MATPVLQKFEIPGALGGISIDIRTASRGRPGPAVLMVHGFKGFKDWGMFPPFAERLAKAGFTAVSFNFSGSGVDDEGEFSRPERFARNTFSAEQDDIARVVGALDAGALGVPAPTSVGLVGHSRGGGAAILFAARSPRIAALATWAAIATVHRWSDAARNEWRAAGSFEVVNARTGQVLHLLTETLDDLEANGHATLDIEAAAARIAVPWLIVHGTADETVPMAEAGRLAGARGPSAGDATLLVDGAGHTFGAVHPFAGTPAPLHEVFDRTVSFLGHVLT